MSEDEVKRAMDSFCDGARSLLVRHGKDKEKTQIHRAWRHECADVVVVANHVFFLPLRVSSQLARDSSRECA